MPDIPTGVDAFDHVMRSLIERCLLRDRVFYRPITAKDTDKVLEKGTDRRDTSPLYFFNEETQMRRWELCPGDVSYLYPMDELKKQNSIGRQIGVAVYDGDKVEFHSMNGFCTFEDNNPQNALIAVFRRSI